MVPYCFHMFVYARLHGVDSTFFKSPSCINIDHISQKNKPVVANAAGNLRYYPQSTFICWRDIIRKDNHPTSVLLPPTTFKCISAPPLIVFHWPEHQLLAIFTSCVERTVTVYHKKDPVLVVECFTADNCSSQQSTLLLLSSLTVTI